MHISNFLKAIQYQIAEGQRFGWQCFGDESHVIDYANNDSGYEASCTFDRSSGTIFMIDFHDTDRDYHYRFFNPAYKDAYVNEAAERFIDVMAEYDGVKTVELEVFADIIGKITAVANGEEYDPRVTVEFELSKEILYSMMMMAHRKDITLNELICEILDEYIQENSDGE